MSTQSPDPEPTMGEAAGYFGTGAFFALAVVVAVGLSIVGFSASSDSRDARLSAAGEDFASSQLDEGEQIFGQRCSSCHGSEGQGGIGPSFVSVVDRIPEVTDHEAVVRDGRNIMPSFGGSLSDEQISLVVRFEREVLNNG